MQGPLPKVRELVRDLCANDIESHVNLTAACIQYFFWCLDYVVHPLLPFGQHYFVTVFKSVDENMSDDRMSLWFYQKLRQTAIRSRNTSGRIVPFERWCDFTRRFMRAIIDGTEPMLEQALVQTNLDAVDRQNLQRSYNTDLTAAWVYIAHWAFDQLSAYPRAVSFLEEQQRSQWHQATRECFSRALSDTRWSEIV